MSLLQRLRRWLAGPEKKNTYTYISGEIPELISTNPAAPENRRRLSDSLVVSPSHTLETNELYQRWIMLSPREQDVTALTCLRFTNPQIAARLGLSKETVRTYLEKVLIRFNLQSKADLRVTFANWDFSEWERRKSHR